MKTEQSDAVQQEIRIEAKPETIFEYFTDPEKMLRWKGIEATLEPRPGGTYRVNGKDIARGEYVEIERPKRVVFTWGWEAEGHPIPPGSSTVEVTLTPDGEGTLVRLTHRGLPTEAQGAHAEGWQHFLPRLADAAAGRDPGADPWAAEALGDGKAKR